MPEILKFEKPQPEPVEQVWWVPDMVEWLERIGFKFRWVDDNVQIRYPSDLGLELPEHVNQAAVARALAEKVAQDRSLDMCIRRFVHDRHKWQLKEAMSVLSGGPFDGERIPVSTWGGTFPRKVRRAWWAVYTREFGNLHADFRGYATSKAKAKTQQFAMRARTEGNE